MAEAVDLHNARECGTGMRGHGEDRSEGGERANERDGAERLLIALRIKQRIDDHDDHAEDREHKFRQDAQVIVKRRSSEGRRC